MLSNQAGKGSQAFAWCFENLRELVLEPRAPRRERVQAKKKFSVIKRLILFDAYKTVFTRSMTLKVFGIFNQYKINMFCLNLVMIVMCVRC